MEQFNLSKVVCEYVAARDAHELATRPLNSHAPVRKLPHGSPITRRWCDARESLRLALENRDAIPTFQSAVANWMGLCFDASHSRDITERGDRFLEEVLELLQAHGYDQTRVPTLVSYVYGRPVGEPAQEVGGVMVTLAAYCDVVGLDMHHAGDTELARVMQPSVMDKIRAKQAAKNSLHFDTPLPGNAGVARVGVGIGAHALAGEIAAAVSADEASEGCDLSAGLFGPAMTQLIRRIVEEYLSKPAAAAPGIDLGTLEHRIRWIRDITVNPLEDLGQPMLSRVHEFAGEALELIERSKVDANPKGDEWYCEEHPQYLMGHYGCKGAGILDCERIPRMTHIIRQRDQQIFELNAQYGFLSANALDDRPTRVCPCGSGDVEKCPGGCTALQDNSKVGKCTACNGHGMIGGLLPAGGGYDSQPCPDCSPKGGSDALASAASRIVNGARKKAGGGWWMVSPSEMDELRDALQATSAEVKP